MELALLAQGLNQIPWAQILRPGDRTAKTFRIEEDFYLPARHIGSAICVIKNTSGDPHVPRRQIEIAAERIRQFIPKD